MTWSYIFCGRVCFDEETRVESSGGGWLAWFVVVAHDDAPVVCLEVELEDVPDISSGVGWIEERCVSRGPDDDGLGRDGGWPRQGWEDGEQGDEEHDGYITWFIEYQSLWSLPEVVLDTGIET